MLTHGVFFHDSQYGQVQAINQLISAYFQVTFTEWCWVFMDGVWTISLAFTLPLARPAARLSPSRPTASILGLHTMSSFLGILLINFIFTVISMFVLFAQDWFQCRKWDDNDVSNVSWRTFSRLQQTLTAISHFCILPPKKGYHDWRQLRVLCPLVSIHIANPNPEHCPFTVLTLAF